MVGPRPSSPTAYDPIRLSCANWGMRAVVKLAGISIIGRKTHIRHSGEENGLCCDFGRRTACRNLPRSTPSCTISWLRRPSGRFRTPPRRQQALQASPPGCPSRVAVPCCLRHNAPRDRCVRHRRVRIRLIPAFTGLPISRFCQHPAPPAILVW